MRSLSIRPVLIPAIALVLVVLVAVGARWAEGLMDRAPTMSRWRLRGIVLALLVLSTASYVTDLTMFRRLYGYLHVLLGVFTYAVATLAFGALFAAARRPFGRRAAAAVLGLCGLLAVASLFTFNLSQNVRAVAFDRTATLRTALLALQAVSGGEDTTPRLSRAERRALYEREVQARAAADRFGGLPGANIVLVTSDALRADQLGVSGSPLRLTPNLDAVARGGVRLSTPTVCAPHSSFSLSSLHTGDYLQEAIEPGHDSRARRSPTP